MAPWIGISISARAYWARVNVDRTPGGGYQGGYERSVAVRVITSPVLTVGITIPGNLPERMVWLKISQPFDSSTVVDYQLAMNTNATLRSSTSWDRKCGPSCNVSNGGDSTGSRGTGGTMPEGRSRRVISLSPGGRWSCTSAQSDGFQIARTVGISCQNRQETQKSRR
jgi:hypothetical protein